VDPVSALALVLSYATYVVGILMQAPGKVRKTHLAASFVTGVLRKFLV